MRVWCRAAGARVFVYFVRIHTRPTMVRSGARAAGPVGGKPTAVRTLGDDGEGPEILILTVRIRVEKGLTLRLTPKPDHSLYRAYPTGPYQYS